MAENKEHELERLSADQTIAVDVPMNGAGQETPAVDPHGAAATAATAVDNVKDGDQEGERGGSSDWHAEAGRKGALRLRELIREGKLYEQEHGLTRGRQRIRQLIQEGKLYEQEHGLRPKKRGTRGPRMSGEQLLASFFHAVLRLAKPAYRPQIVRLIQELEGK
jgi:hypothetical protein